MNHFRNQKDWKAIGSFSNLEIARKGRNPQTSEEI